MKDQVLKWSRKRGVKTLQHLRCQACSGPLDAEDVPNGFHKECSEEITRDIDEWLGECRGQNS